MSRSALEFPPCLRGRRLGQAASRSAAMMRYAQPSLRRSSVVEQPANRVVEVSSRLPREVSKAVHAAALAFRATVARTRSTTSSPVR